MRCGSYVNDVTHSAHNSRLQRARWNGLGKIFVISKAVGYDQFYVIANSFSSVCFMMF